MNAITLRGVRVHNLKNIDVAIPIQQFTLVTGVSGAGKSSLVFDTLYAEAQRRYLQSFSVHTRQFLERFEPPDCDSISDLPPAVAIRRTNLPASPRVTIGKWTEIDAPLRVLFAHAGVLVCPGCQQAVKPQTVTTVQAALDEHPAGTRVGIAFPVRAESEKERSASLAALQEEGYFRVQIEGTLYRLGEQPLPPFSASAPIWVLIDRIEVGKTPTDRIAESLEGSFRRGYGRLGILADSGCRVFDQRNHCPRCDRLFPALEPRLFDTDDPSGACASCGGTGTVEKTTDSCPACEGTRWNADARAVALNGSSIADLFALPIVDLLDAWAPLTRSLDANPSVVPILHQIRTRLQALVNLDLGYLTLRQPASTLDDGPARRIALAAALASSLINVLYVIDEPTTGLHPRDGGKLLHALQQLRDRGNTVVVIDGDSTLLAAADHVIDLGPGAGAAGGEVTYQGAPAGLHQAAENPTSDYYTGRSFVEVPARRRKPTGMVRLAPVSVNHLRGIEVSFPLGCLCAVTGVSGAGKRSLVNQALLPALTHQRARKGQPPPPGPRVSFEGGGGAASIADVVWLDATPMGRASRSNPATYLKIFDEIRDLFADTTDAKIRNYGPGHFSFNQPGGRCETCEGQGTLTIDMQFLADVRTTCPECQGRRYRREILAIKIRSLSISEILDLTVREAFRFFRAQPTIEKKLKPLLDVGLEYLRIGQSVETLSGSECQRLKLAGHLATRRKTGSLFLLPYPSAGLHPDDVANLLECFDQLIAAGHSLIVIENDLDVIKCADWVIDLGPEGGVRGGRIVAQGTPEDLTRNANSPTGRALSELLSAE